MSPGYVVKAIIRNGLGFVSAPLYLFSQFFEVYTLAQRQLRQALHQAQSGIKNQLGKPPSAPVKARLPNCNFFQGRPINIHHASKLFKTKW